MCNDSRNSMSSWYCTGKWTQNLQIIGLKYEIVVLFHISKVSSYIKQKD